MAACTWKGVTRRGTGQLSAMDIAPSSLPAGGEIRYRQGWRHLVIAAASSGREAARIGPAGDSGRTWYAGTA